MEGEGGGGGAGAPQVPREIQILETAEDIQERRDQVLGRYVAFKDSTRERRQRLEDARRFMYFKRDADELESWINEKLQTASDESYKDSTNLQVSNRWLSLVTKWQWRKCNGRVGTKWKFVIEDDKDYYYYYYYYYLQIL